MNVSVSPGFAGFRSAYDGGRGTLVWRRDVADLETPVAAFLKIAHGRANSFLLESVEGGAARGRYSIIGMEPDLIWRCRGGRAAVNRYAQSAPHAFVADPRPALDSLRAMIAETRLDVPANLPPMAGGLVGYLGYDMVRQMERLPAQNPDVIDVPEGVMLRPTLFAIFDNVNDELTLAAPVYPQADMTAAAAWEHAQKRLDEAEAALERPLPHQPPPVMLPDPPAPASNFSKPDFLAAVERCKDYIMAGDAFQIVISQRFSVPFVLPPFSLYRALRRINPAPFLFFLDFGGFAVVGSSPEVLVRLRDGTVTIRPLAGTRRRGATYEEDQALEAELLSDPKERAEHLMLLDLGRNDVGRVAELGSVKVTESFVIERFSHVMHISSNVEGKLREGLEALDALVGGFPAGTLSGAPKVRAMEIIEELEPDRRNIYAGCIGYFAANGTMDTCIGLRTALVKDGVMYVQAGAGIVADSEPEFEHEECRQKARALMRAAEEAVRFAAGKSAGTAKGRNALKAFQLYYRMKRPPSCGRRYDLARKNDYGHTSHIDENLVVGESDGFADFVVLLSEPGASAVSVSYNDANGTAASGPDYLARSGTLTFAPGETVKTVRVPVINDTTAEAKEDFLFNLFNPVNAMIGNTSGMATIIDNDAACGTPVMAIGDQVVDETAGTVSFTVTLDRPNTGPVTVNYATAPGTAGTADYTTVSGTLAFAPGETTKTVTVPIVNDTAAEAEERFKLVLSSPVGATLPDPRGTALIGASDQPTVVTPDVSVANLVVDESDGFAEFVVRLNAPSASAVSVSYSDTTGTAANGPDFLAQSGTLTFAPGETVKTVRVPVINDTTVEPDETFFFNLFSPVNATVASGSTQVAVTIVDDETVPVLAYGHSNDTYVVSQSGTRIIEATNGGTDLVRSRVTYSLPVNVENLTLIGASSINGTGNGGNNVITGNAGNNVLDGQAGVDTVSYAPAASAVTVSLAVTTPQNTGGGGADTLSGFENLTGSGFNDNLTGNSAANVINGGAGIDTMVGGQGNDTYFVDNPADVVTENPGAGTDRVLASVSYGLASGSQIEFLRANAGVTGLSLVGNELANTIVGGAGNDTLTGASGADALTGGAGADAFVYVALPDLTVAASGRDTIADFTSAAGDKIDLHLIDAVSNLAGDQPFTFIGTKAFSGNAGELNYAPSGANTIVLGDVNGDKTADFSILLTGAHILNASDFVL